MVVVVNRAPSSAFRRREMYAEIMSSVDAADVAFVGLDQRVCEAAWAGRPVGRGRFTRSVENVLDAVGAVPTRPNAARLDVAS